MASATVVLSDVGRFDRRVSFAGVCRHVSRFIATHVLLALAASAAVALLIVAITLTAAWIVDGSLSGDAQAHVKARSGPGTLALGYGMSPAGSATTNFEAQWVRRTASRPLIVAVPQDRAKPVARLAQASLPAIPPVMPPSAAKQGNNRPLPVRRPATIELSRAPGTEPGARAEPQVAMVTPSPQADSDAPALSAAASRTAVYDIAAHTVYMPDGQKLEAHSGLGDKRDDPRYFKVRMRGPTPPNVYDLTMRERLFHGVRAIRLNPVDEGKMHGRDGMLAHTYMLGPNGQSNGCVSFKDYRKFLTAFLNGKVDRLVVVPELGNTPWRVAARQGGVPTRAGRRYAANAPRAEDSSFEPTYTTR